jgi:hypothetical protein
MALTGKTTYFGEPDMALTGKTTYFGGPEESLSTPQVTKYYTPPVDYSGFNFGVLGAPGVAYMPQDLAGYTPPNFGNTSGGTGIDGFTSGGTGIGGLMGALAPYPTGDSMPLPLAMITPTNRNVGALTPSDYSGTTTYFGGASEQPTTQTTDTEPGFFKRAVSGIEKAGETLDKNKLLARLLGGGLTAGVGAIMGNRGQQAATRLQSDLAKLGATQRQEGQALVAAAQRGELTAPQMQQLEAFRARQAQALASRGLSGGTAEQQLAGQVENMRQQFLQQNLQQGFSLLQIGDQYTQQAITAGYNASQAAQDASGRFYSAALQALGAMPSQQPVTNSAQGAR